MFNDFLSLTATAKRMGSATKTKRVYTTLSGTFNVSRPQTKSELDLIQGMHVTRYIFYTDYDSTLRSGDSITVDSEDYVIVSSEPNKVKNISYRRLVTDRDQQ